MNKARKFMIYVEGRSTPTRMHESRQEAMKELERLALTNVGKNIHLLEVEESFKIGITLTSLDTVKNVPADF